jgi:hypothetical protein
MSLGTLVSSTNKTDRHDITDVQNTTQIQLNIQQHEFNKTKQLAVISGALQG